mmetsp:Transcript_51391/g.137462  ORF Transcript_51391/g.137462 Transcript_51391/m.137462 type:complete len:325 (-) Transcript_51391:11-985(-)
MKKWRGSQPHACGHSLQSRSRPRRIGRGGVGRGGCFRSAPRCGARSAARDAVLDAAVPADEHNGATVAGARPDGDARLLDAAGALRDAEDGGVASEELGPATAWEAAADPAATLADAALQPVFQVCAIAVVVVGVDVQGRAGAVVHGVHDLDAAGAPATAVRAVHEGVAVARVRAVARLYARNAAAVPEDHRQRERLVGNSNWLGRVRPRVGAQVLEGNLLEGESSAVGLLLGNHLGLGGCHVRQVLLAHCLVKLRALLEHAEVAGLGVGALCAARVVADQRVRYGVVNLAGSGPQAGKSRHEPEERHDDGGPGGCSWTNLSAF